MYEAPDRYKRMISARLPDGESLGVASQAGDDGSSPLRDAQLIARGEFAPFFAAVNSVAAIFMAMILYGHVSAGYLGGWALAVIATNLGAMQLARTQAVTHVGRSGRKVPKWQMVGDIVARALIWLSLPAVSFTSLAPDNQAVAATLIAGLGIAAIGLVVVPACVTAWMAVFTAVLLPLGVPILPPEATARWAARLGVVPQIERGAGKRTELPQWFADRLGWEQLVDDVAAVRARLSPEERARVVYFAPSYGQAGALEWLGRARGLVPVYSAHNNYFLWGPPEDPVEVAIVLGQRRADLQRLFAEVTPAGVHHCGYCMPWRDEMPIWIVRGPRVRLADRWARWKHFE